MYKLKEKPEDFIVDEVIDVSCSEVGDFSYFVVKKRDYATPAAVEKIAKFMHVPIKSIGYAGTKDRHAITTQWISIEGPESKLQGFSDNLITLEFKGKGNKKIYLGQLEGNKFTITARNITQKPKAIKQFLNLFDEQRFSMNNVEIGKYIVKKEFKKAVEKLMESNGYYERLVKEHYDKTGDAVNSLRKIPMHVLIFFVHAYQSELWNRTAEELSKTVINNIEVPIIGFGSEFATDDIRKITETILREEGINQRDFILKSFPELSSEGSTRKLYTDVTDLKIGELEDDELNKGMKKVTISFFLTKGCYATMAIRHMFKE